MKTISVYVLMPTKGAAHVPATVARWRSQGYRVALWMDPNYESPVTLPCELLVRYAYPGVWNAVNTLARMVFHGIGADVCVFAGDDMDPDGTRTATQLGLEYLRRFPDGLGVMQPCGDPQGQTIDGKANAARICGSAWFGRGWTQRAFGGLGPMPPWYQHFYGDEELKEVAERLGLLWWRPDVTQWHRHWTFPGGLPRQPYHESLSRDWWDADKKEFEKRKSGGFPGSELL